MCEESVLVGYTVSYTVYCWSLNVCYHLKRKVKEIRNNKHQLMHQNIYNLYSLKSPTCFDPAGPSSGRIILIHYDRIYIFKCECALGFILSAVSRWPSRVETCRRLLRIKIIYILVHWLVFIISYDTVHGHGTH
jgi:hypothetical protein